MMGVSVWFKEQTGVPMEPVLTPLAVFIATLLGTPRHSRLLFPLFFSL
jgi:hypothetical protein